MQAKSAAAALMRGAKQATGLLEDCLNRAHRLRVCLAARCDAVPIHWWRGRRPCEGGRAPGPASRGEGSARLGRPGAQSCRAAACEMVVVTRVRVLWGMGWAVAMFGEAELGRVADRARRIRQPCVAGVEAEAELCLRRIGEGGV